MDTRFVSSLLICFKLIEASQDNNNKRTINIFFLLFCFGFFFTVVQSSKRHQNYRWLTMMYCFVECRACLHEWAIHYISFHILWSSLFVDETNWVALTKLDFTLYEANEGKENNEKLIHIKAHKDYYQTNWEPLQALSILCGKSFAWGLLFWFC